MRKTILVPTDFSANALQAAQYACQIAKQNDYDIELFHCYTSSTAIDEENSTELKADVLIKELKEQEYCVDVLFGFLSKFFSTHPTLVKRVIEMEKFANK